MVPMGAVLEDHGNIFEFFVRFLVELELGFQFRDGGEEAVLWSWSWYLFVIHIYLYTKVGNIVSKSYYN
jgi:hypothetical protein